MDQWQARPAEHEEHFINAAIFINTDLGKGASRASECSPQEHHAVDSCRALSSWITEQEEKPLQDWAINHQRNQKTCKCFMVPVLKAADKAKVSPGIWD